MPPLVGAMCTGTIEAESALPAITASAKVPAMGGCRDVKTNTVITSAKSTLHHIGLGWVIPGFTPKKIPNTNPKMRIINFIPYREKEIKFLNVTHEITFFVQENGKESQNLQYG